MCSISSQKCTTNRSSKIVSFKLSGDWGHFKKPFSTSSPLTYSLPTPTSLCGLVGAILGWSRDSYIRHAREVGLSFSVKPDRIEKFRMGILWASTKYDDSSYLSCGILAKISKGIDVSRARTLISMEVLRKPSFTIHVNARDEAFLEKFADYLDRGYTHYTPYLGITEFIAKLSFLGYYELEPVDSLPEDKVTFNSVVPARLVKTLYNDEAFVERLPIAMTDDRVVLRYESFLISTEPLTFLPDNAEFERGIRAGEFLVFRSSQATLSSEHEAGVQPDYLMFVGYTF